MAPATTTGGSASKYVRAFSRPTASTAGARATSRDASADDATADPSPASDDALTTEWFSVEDYLAAAERLAGLPRARSAPYSPDAALGVATSSVAQPR